MCEYDEYLYEERQKHSAVLKAIANFQFSPIPGNNHLGDMENCSIFCEQYISNTNKAISDVKALMERLDYFEGLFPCTKVMGKDFPLYNDDRFQNNLKVCTFSKVSYIVQNLKWIYLYFLIAGYVSMA